MDAPAELVASACECLAALDLSPAQGRRVTVLMPAAVGGCLELLTGTLCSRP